MLWQRLDRILGYKHPYGEMARKQLSQVCREIEQHISMVFNEFLSGQVSRRKRLRIFVNGNEVKPWDPFCESEKQTKKLHPVSFEVEYEGVHGEVILQPFVLPHQNDFSSPEAFRIASGPNNWNQQQGFYIYRANRMIQSGGWSGLRAPDEHTKLARVAVSFSPVLDEAFKINVAKMRVQLPAKIRDVVKEAIIPVTKLARETYDRKIHSHIRSILEKQHKTTATSMPTTTGMDASKAGQQTKLLADTKRDRELLSGSQWAERILSVATKQERPVVMAVLARLNDN